MKDYESGIYISYAWGKEQEEIVNSLDQSFQARGIKIIRDKRDLGYKGSIKEFMERIGRGLCVIVVVSDKYLRSPNCMFELAEIAENKQLHDRIFPIILKDATIYDPVKRIEYIKYWETKRAELAEAIKSVDPANLQGIREDMDNYDRFRGKISGLSSILADMNALTPEIHRDSDFEFLYSAVEKRLRGSSDVKVKTLGSASKIDTRSEPVAIWPKEKSPFPGLRAFEPEDAPVFFGRGAETEILLRRISDPNCRFLVVVGASGSGKSSLVGAGLLPLLKEGALPGSENWLVATFTPDEWGTGDPLTTLTDVLKELLKLKPRDIRPHLLEGAAGLRQLFEEHLATGPVTRRALLFIDQFEELFTRVADVDLSQKFQALLEEAARSSRILMVVTIRDDFYHYCVKSPVLSRLINRNTDSTFTLSAPGQLELYEMISGPARVAGLQFEAGLVHQILDDTGDDPGALALMAYALDQLYKASADDDKMTFAGYNSFGGVKGAIGTRAQETFEGLSEDAKKTLPQVFRELLEVDDSGTATRKRAPLERVEHGEASSELVQALVKARLLVTSQSASDQALVEVAHEALFRSWPELKAWIEEAQDDLILLRQVRIAADWWEKHQRRSAYLWPDERLQPVYAMRRRLEPDLNETEQEFIRLEVERLLEEVNNPATSHRRRSWIGERLDTLGDGRPGVGLVQGILPLRAEERKAYTFISLRAGEIRLWGDRPEHKGLPDLVWMPVEGGSIKIQEQIFIVQPFHIAKYPITYMQFQAFIDAKDGFANPRWWQGLSVDEYDRSKPGEQNLKSYNYPRENVSWYDAMAFCRWLNSHLNWVEFPTNLSLKSLDDYKGLRLPTEWEWQWAATGGHKEYEYPWGAEWDESKANTSESGLARSTAVGMYPAGSAKCGALDLSGNVWEWCLNEYGKPENLNVSGSDYRVVRGGSWDSSPGLARASRRGNFGPRLRDYFYGFRIVVRPLSP